MMDATSWKEKVTFASPIKEKLINVANALRNEVVATFKTRILKVW